MIGLRFVVAWQGRFHVEQRTFDADRLGDALDFALIQRRKTRGRVPVKIGAVCE